jgi:hypothetical protein
MTVLTHVAELDLAPGADEHAPGAAVTVALCGHWEHDGPCRSPHVTQSQHRDDGRLAVRVTVLAPADAADDVRRAVVAALRTGHQDGPSGPSTWRVLTDAPDRLTPDDEAWAGRQSPAAGGSAALAQ